jgi:hypothetical protein
MACSSGDLVFTDGPQRTLYTTRLAAFQPRKLMTVSGSVGPHQHDWLVGGIRRVRTSRRHSSWRNRSLGVV